MDQLREQWNAVSLEVDALRSVIAEHRRTLSRLNSTHEAFALLLAQCHAEERQLSSLSLRRLLMGLDLFASTGSASERQQRAA